MFSAKPIRAITTARMLLLPQVAAHADEMFAVLSDPAIYIYENKPPESAAWLRARFTRLEARASADGREQWLNWVLRLATGELIGFVQATIAHDQSAGIAYVLSSAYWGRGLASEAVIAMIAELRGQYGVERVTAVLKRENFRSRRLLTRHGFLVDETDMRAELEVAFDELRMRLARTPI